MCQIICCEPFIGHTAKKTFTVCLQNSSLQRRRTRQRLHLPCAPLKKLTVNYAIRSTCFIDRGLEEKTHGNTFAVCQGKVPFFAVCIALAHGKGVIVCRVPGAWHTANSRLFAVCHAVTAHGKRPFQRGSEHCSLFCRGPRKALGKVFAVCPKCSTRQASSLPSVVCRELFAVYYTRQTLCRV